MRAFLAVADAKQGLSEADYLRFMLVGAGVCSQDLLDGLAESFAAFDAKDGGRGTICAHLSTRPTLGGATRLSHVNPMVTRLSTAQSAPEIDFELTTARSPM